MKQNRTLYYLTAAATLAFLLHAGSSLFGALGPTADVVAASKRDHTFIRLSDFEPGDVRGFRHGDIPYYVWRRNADDIAMAKGQDDPASWLNPKTAKTDGSLAAPAYDKDLTVDHEWFFVIALNPDGPGCFVKSRMGNFGGFFDPCRSAHFDLAGRVRSGPAAENLIVIPGRLTEDGSYFRLDLSFLPK